MWFWFSKRWCACSELHVDCLLYCRRMLGSLLLSAEQGIVNTSSGKDSFSMCQGPIGRIWVPVPMDLWSGMGEVGSTAVIGFSKHRLRSE